MSKDKIKSLYDTFVADGYEMESEDEFRTNLGDPNKRKAAYDALVADGYEMESYEDFENNIGFGLESYARSLGIGEETIKKAKEWLGGTTAQPSAQPSAQQTQAKKQTFDDVLAEAKDYDMTATKDAPKDGVLTTYVPGEIIGQQKQRPLYSKDILKSKMDNDLADAYSERVLDGKTDGYVPRMEREAWDERNRKMHEDMDKMAEGIANSRADVDSSLERIETELKDRLDNVENYSSRYSTMGGGYIGNMDTGVGRMSEDTQNLTIARDLLKEAQDIRKSGELNEEGLWGNTKDAGRTFINTITDFDTWDAGLKSTQEGQRLLAILDKAETEQPLTRSEEQLLDAWLANTIVQSSTKTGAGRTIGQTVGQMAPFVLEMMLNPASGIGKASTRALMRKVGNQISKRFLRRATAVGTRLATDAVGAGVMAGTTGAGHVVGGAYERMAQDPTLSFGQALGTSYVDRTIENWSEMFGAGMLSPLSSKAMAWTTRAARKGGQNGLGKWMSKGVEITNKVKGSKVGRAISEINKAARYEGPVEEYLEEVVGNATRATLGIDGMEFSTKEGKGVFNLEDNVVTFLSVAVPGVAQAAVNTTAYGIGNLYTKRKLNNADKHGMDAFGDRWDGIRRILDSIDYNDPIQVMMSLSRIQTNDEAEARIVADYAKAKGMRSGFESASSNVLQDNAETASAQGAQAETPQEVRRVGKSLSEAQSAIIGINGGESIKSAIDSYIADGAEDIAQISAVLDGLSESDREVAEDYFLARTRMQSYADKVQEIIDDAVSQEEERLAPYIYGGDSELEYDANGDIVRDEDGNAVERTTPRIFAEAVITPVNAHLKDEEPYSVMLTNYYPDSPFVTYVDANGVPQMVKRDDANIEVIEHDYDEYMAEYRAKIEADADARADMMLEHNERTNRAMNIGETIETLNGQMTVLNNDGQGNVTLAPVQLNSKGETEVVRGSQPVTMSAREAMALQDEYYERPTEVADNSQSAEVVDNMSANQAQNEGISNGENEQNVSKPTVEPIPTVQNGKKSRVAYEQVPVARTIEEVYGQFDEQEEVDEFIDLNIAEAEAAVKNASKPKPKMSTDIEAYKQAKAKWQEEQAGLAEAQKRLDYWKEVKAESERMQGLDTTTEISQDTKKEDNAPRSAMEYVASMIGRLDPGSYRKETGYGVKEQRKAGPIFLKKENGGMTVEGLAEWICEQPEAQEWGIQPGMDSEVRDMIIEVLSHGSPKAYIRDAHAQQAKADAYGEEQYLENMAAAQGYASADDMIAHDEVFLAEAIRAHYGLDENEYYANLAEEYEQEDNRKYGQGNERQDNGTSAERLGQSNTTAEVADVSGSSEVLSEEQSADTAGAESGNEQRELSGSTESGNEGTAENEAVSGEPVEQEPSVAPEQQAVVERVGQWEQQLGVKVNVITDASEVENETVREQLREKKEGDSVKGWFDPKTGEAYVYLPDNHSVEDVDETIIHEVIAHKGLRGLLGRAKFNKLCDAVWGSMSAKDKARFLSYVDGKVGNVRDQRAAADEYIAHLAEKMDKAELTKAEKGIWQTIVDYIMDALEKVGIKVTDKQIEALIKASYANMVSKASQTADTKDLLEYAQRDVERRAMLRKVYHGTGAEFDKFDHSFMSTGEGNQAFGWGTYVSEVEDVAKSYATTNHEENAEYESAKVKLDEAQKKWDEFGGQMYDKYGVTYTEKLNDEEKAKNKELLDAYNTAKSEMNSHAVARRLYTVEIPDDNGSNYIVYDKDVPKKMKDEVKRRLYNVLIEEDYKGAEKELKRELDNLFAMDMDGNNLYGNVSAYLGGDKNASEFLNSMGFVGIKYPVGSLSGVKSDASNYVIFNEEDAKIEGHMRFRKLKEVNDKFNAELQQQIDGTLPAGHIYQLGMPSDVLKSAGINDLPIELAASRLVDKSMQENHPFDLAEVENLPNAIHNPLAVFLSASNVGSKVLLTELKHGGKNFVVALRVRPNKKRIKVNQIRSLYPKDIKGLLNWINNDLATYVDKPRMIEWIGIQKNELLSKPQSNSVEVRKQLVSATKVIEEFENPKLSEENEETKFKKYKSKDGKETAYRQLSLFDTEGEASNDRSRTNSVQREGDSRLATLNSLRELEEGEVCNVERRFSEKGGFDFTRGEKVLFVEDVAYIFKNLEDEAIENSFVAFVKGDEVTVMHVGMGAQTMTVTDQTAVIAGAERLNADKVFFVHNHPSGKLVCSREDINLYTSLKMALGDKLWDGIIINTRSGKYGVFNENGIVSSGEEHISPQKEYPLKIYGFNKQAFHGDVVNIEPSSSGIAKFVSTQRLGSRNKINALLLNNSFGCLGNVFLSETDITEKNAYPVMQKLVADAISMGARSIVLYGRAPFVYFTGGKLNLGSRLSEYVKMLSSGQIQLQDVIQLGEGSYTSAIDDGIRFRKANRNQVGFVSNAMVAVENVKQEKATPEQWLKMIEKQGGLKAGEDKWLGLSDWLKSLSPNPSPNGEGNSKPRVVTKDEVLEFIGENMIQIEEVTYGEGMPKHAQEKLDELNEEFQALIWEGDEETGSVYTSDWVDYAWSAMVDRYGDDIDGAFEIEGNGTNAELVPMLDYNDEMVDQAKYFLEINDYTSKPINSTRLGYTTEGLENKREIALTVPTIESWNESDEIHFGDAGNGRAVAWIRFGETTDADGSKVLVIDEIQSKRHQEGREKGYVDKSRMDEIRNLVAKNDERLNEITPSIKTIYNGNKELGLSGAQKQHEEAVSKLPKEQRSEYDKLKEENYSLTEEFTSLQKAGETGIPSAPFEKNWHELAMKRMLRLAAEEGFDKVAWTTGAQQAERYNIGSVVSQIESRKSSWGNSKDVTFYTGNGETVLFVSNKSGKIVGEEGPGLGVDVIDKTLSDVVGKSLAEKLMTDGDVSLSGDGLSIGGDGMKGFYDKMLPSFVQKYTKKWGAKVGEVTLPNLEESAQKMWSVDVTPQMKESVEEQVMFRFIGKKGAENLDKAEEATTRLDNLNVARQMENAGKDAKAIKMATGWERGADGMWRYEVEDNIKFDKDGNVDFGKLKDYVDAPELFAAYPELADAELNFRDDISANGYYDKEKNEIGVSRSVSNDRIKDVLVHEIQHAIQYIEGFAEGGNLMTSQPLIKEIVELAGKGAETASLDTIAQAFEEGYIPKERTAEAQRIAEEHGYSDLGKYIRSLNAYGYYRSLGGEVESRNVQKRMGMSLAERRAKLASETEDVAREDQIILKSGLGLNNVQDMNDTNDLVVYAKRDVERREGTRFSKKDAQGNPINSDGTLKLEEVISVEDIKDDDFLSPNRNILLPPLPLIVDEAIQANGKRVVIKKNIFVKNQKHKDLNPEDSRRILQQTLYTPSLYGQNQKRSRPYNWILIHEGNTNSAVLVEVNESKDNIEVVNWHYISGEAIERKKRQAQREGGLILTLESVAANTSSDLSSESKDNKNNSNEQATEGKTIFRKTSAGFDALAYAQQKVKEREDEVRMRKRKAMVRIKDKETEDQKRYNDETSGWFANLLEAWVDFLRPVRKLQESIEKTFGKLADYQNPYLLALTASSRNKIEEELLKVNLIEPMDKFLRGLIRKNNVSYDEIDRYLNAKHGLERNVKLAERDAKNLATDEDGNVDQAVYLNELQNNRKKDYSGLTDLFRTETEKEDGTKVSVAELERRANEYIKSFEDRMGQENTEKLWAHVKALNAFALQKSYSSNMLSKDEFDELANMYEYYVPLRGFAEKTAGDIWNYLSDNTYGVVNPVKKTAEGRTSRADSIVATLYNMAESAIVQGNKNKTALALLNLAEQSPSSLLSVSRMWYVKNPDTKKWEVSVPDLENCDTQEKVTEAIQKHEEEMRAKEVLGLAKRKKGKLEIQYKALPYHVAEHGVRVKRGGQEYIVYVNGNPKAAQALNGLLNEDVWHASKKNLDKFTKYVKWIFRWKAKTYTSLNPEFIITNFQRDLQSAFTIMAVRHGQKFAFDLTKHVFENVPLTSVIGKENKGRAKAVGIYTLYKKFFEGTLDMNNKRERYFHEFMMNGGETGYTQLDSVEDFKKKLENLDENIAKHGAKAAIKAVGDFIEFANRGIENAVRFAAFQTAREHGMSLLNSINEAKEASVNFNRKGSGALLNATARDSYMFINPAIQSTYQYAKLMKDYGWRGVGAFGVWSGLGVAIPLINIYVASMWAGDDDDETTMEDMYMALSPYKRRNFINIYIGNQTYYSVNLPVEQRVPYGLACIAMEMLTGQIDAEQGAWDMAGQVFNNILPRDIYNDNLGNARYSKGMSDFIEGVAKGLTPDLIADIAGPLVWNEDFLGRPITGVNKYNDYLPEWQRIGNNTPEWVRDMAKSVAKFDGNEYDKDWYDSQYLNPGGWYHIITQNVPLLPIISKGYKTYAAMAREDDVDEVVKNIPFGSRFLTTVNKDYAENRAMRYEFELLMSDIDDVDQQNKAINADKSISVMEAAELKEALKNTPEGIAHNVWTKRPKKGKSLRTRYDNIYDEYREARNNNDVKRKRELQAELDEIRKDAIERINKKVNETYGE